MISQYPWASVKNQERRHIEIGAIVTLLAAIISFYSIPDFADKVIIEKAYIPPPVEVLSIPATIQPPEIIAPPRPTMVIKGGEDDIDDDIDVISVGVEPGDYFDRPPPYVAPDADFYPYEFPPTPIGGVQAIMRNVIYPPIAIEARQEGRVTVEALIGKDGIVKEVKILKGLPGTGLDEAAMAAVLMTPFNPAYQRDKPVPVKMAIPVDFRLR